MAVKTASYASTVTCWEKHFDSPDCCFPNFSRNLSGKLFSLLTTFVSVGLSKMQLMSLKWLFEEKITVEDAIYSHFSFFSLSKNFSVFSKEPWQGCQNGFHVSLQPNWKKRGNYIEEVMFFNFRDWPSVR